MLSGGSRRLGGWVRPRWIPAQLALHGAWAIVDQGLFALSNFALNLLLARWLLPEDYGAFSVAFSIFLFLGVLHTSFFTEPMLVFGSSDRYRMRLGSYLRILVRGHAWFSVVAAVALLTFSTGISLVGHRELADSLIGVALMSPFALLLWLSRRACYALLAPHLAASGSALYMAIMLSGMSLLNGRGWLTAGAALGAMGVGSLAGSVWLLARVLAHGDAGSDVSRSEVLLSHMRYGRWAASTGVLSWASGSIAFLLFPLWGGLEAVAGLKALMNLLLPVLHAIGAISVLLIPNLVQRRATGDFGGLVRLALITFAVGTMLNAALLGAFARPILHWLYDGKYDAVSRWLPLLALLPFLSSTSSVFGSALRAVERPDLVFKAYAASAAAAFVLAMPVLRHGGIGGAVVLILVTGGVTAGMLWSASRGVFKGTRGSAP